MEHHALEESERSLLEHFNLIRIKKPLNRNTLLQALNTPKATLEKLPLNSNLQFFSNNIPTVLVAEDNISTQIIVRGMLKKYGIQVEIASNGQEVLKAIKTKPFDLILMDCEMPVMDGYQAASALRQQGFAEIPIIAITVQAQQSDRKRCLEAGMNDYLSKPINVHPLHEKLKLWLPLKPHHSDADSVDPSLF